jgi:hypothetical protein
MMLSSQWAELPVALEDARPEFVYVSEYYGALLSQRAPAVRAWLERCYRPVHVDASEGTWHQTQPSCR